MAILDLVCTEANVERDGIAIFVNVRVPVFPELLAEMVRNKIYIPLMLFIQIWPFQDFVIYVNWFLAAATLHFLGNSSMSLRYDQSVTTEADDLIFRFRTAEQHGLLMSSRHDRSGDRLEVTLDAARIKIHIHVIKELKYLDSLYRLCNFPYVWMTIVLQ